MAKTPKDDGTKRLKRAKSGSPSLASSNKATNPTGADDGVTASKTADDEIERIYRYLESGALNDHVVTDLMLRCAAVLIAKRALQSELTNLSLTTLESKITATVAAVSCYRRAPGVNMVKVWTNGHAEEGKISLAEAKRRGLLPCG